MQYHTLFDITTAGYKDWLYVIVAAVVVVTSVVVTWVCYRMPKSRADLPFFWIFLSLAMVLLAGIPYWDYRELLDAYRNKKYRVAAGKVENYWHEKGYNRRKKKPLSGGFYRGRRQVRLYPKRPVRIYQPGSRPRPLPQRHGAARKLRPLPAIRQRRVRQPDHQTGTRGGIDYELRITNDGQCSIALPSFVNRHCLPLRGHRLLQAKGFGV
jgi:hypothetical protein